MPSNRNRNLRHTELYLILGIDVEEDGLTLDDITDEMVSKAFRRRSKVCHPDAGGSQEDMADLGRAYRLLKTEDLRAAYEEFGTSEEAVSSPVVPGLRTLSTLINQTILTQGVFGGTDLKDFSRSSLLKACHTNLDAMKASIQTQLTTVKDQAKKLENMLERLERKNPQQKGPDVFKGMLQQQLSHFHAALAQGEESLADLQACRELLEGYTYRVDTVPPGQASSTQLRGKSATTVIIDEFFDYSCGNL